MMKIKSLFFLIITISLVVSCKEEEGNDQPKNSHRITQVFTHSDVDNSDYKYVISYEGEKVTRMTILEKDESENWMELLKSEISYSGENATETFYKKETSGWKINLKYELKISNGLMLEEHVYDYEESTWVDSYAYYYQYSGRNLMSWIRREDKNDDGTLEEDSMGVYTYQDSKLTQFIKHRADDLGIYSPCYKELFSYEGGNMINWTGFQLDESNNWVNFKNPIFRILAIKHHKSSIFIGFQGITSGNRSIWIPTPMTAMGT